MEYLKKIVVRIGAEPALLTAVILAVGNLFAQDLSSFVPIIESLVVLGAGLFVRSKVAPVSRLEPMTVEEFVDEFGPGEIAA